MDLRSQKGFTGIDVSVSVIVLLIFISIIATMSYNFNTSSKEIERRSEAVNIAIKEIEEIKHQGFEQYKDKSKKSGNYKISDNEGVPDKQGYYKTIEVIDYTDIEGNENKSENMVKKATVEVLYNYKGQEQSVKLSTVLSKEI